MSKIYKIQKINHITYKLVESRYSEDLACRDCDLHDTNSNGIFCGHINDNDHLCSRIGRNAVWKIITQKDIRKEKLNKIYESNYK